MKCGLAGDVERLIEDQAVTWPMLARGLEGLRQSQTRVVRIRWYDVLIRHIPHRIGSTTAKVDSVSIQQRPCFLCRANLPPEEKGVALDSEFTAYCNPFPILDRHLTIVHNDHRPQLIQGYAASMLRFAQLLPQYFLIYNGPECGASAPDHLHFQACSRDIFPIEADAARFDELSIPDYDRRVFVLKETDASKLADRIDGLISALADVTLKSNEPLLNIAAFYNQNLWTAFIFPRKKHRPRVYETGELTVSPAAIDLSGVFVVPKEADFQRICAEDVAGIFNEVTLDADAFNDVLSRLRRIMK
jgi:hypothetical protein